MVFYFLLLSGMGQMVFAQQGFSSVGGEIKDSGGELSYSMGQVFYAMNNDTNGVSVAEGIQQIYDVSVVSEILETNVLQLNLSAYPNPVSNHLVLHAKNVTNEKLHFTLYNSAGQVIYQQAFGEVKTTIDMKTMQSATYFLKVFNNNRNLKTFKIIKR
ncbi:MAG: T9SS type A sorting domain-containing protein [Fibrobacteria bacterium]|nr:T9SS type A sorting domain-containing protein [Fibrobacteria bacterium]